MHNNLELGEQVIVHDRYRLAIPLRATVLQLSGSNDGVLVTLKQEHGNNHIGKELWVHAQQCVKKRKLEIQQHNPLLNEIAHLISDIGICPSCGEVFKFNEEGTSAGCACSTTGNTCNLSILEQIRRIEAKIPRSI